MEIKFKNGNWINLTKEQFANLTWMYQFGQTDGYDKDLSIKIKEYWDREKILEDNHDKR